MSAPLSYVWSRTSTRYVWCFYAISSRGITCTCRFRYPMTTTMCIPLSQLSGRWMLAAHMLWCLAYCARTMTEVVARFRWRFSEWRVFLTHTNPKASEVRVYFVQHVPLYTYSRPWDCSSRRNFSLHPDQFSGEVYRSSSAKPQNKESCISTSCGPFYTTLLALAGTHRPPPNRIQKGSLRTARASASSEKDTQQRRPREIFQVSRRAVR